MRKRFRLVAVSFFIFCNVRLLYPQQKTPTQELQGTTFFQRQCIANACPCQKNGAPNHGTCEAADFVHIRIGRYGKLYLDGLNAVVVGTKTLPGSTPPFMSTKTPIALNAMRLPPFCNS